MLLNMLVGLIGSQPEQSQFWAQTRLLRASLSWGLKLLNLETAQTPWAPAPPLGWPHGEKASPYLQPKPLMFQLVPLPLTLPPHMAVKSPTAPSPTPPISARDALEVIPPPSSTSPAPTAYPPGQGLWPRTVLLAAC